MAATSSSSTAKAGVPERPPGARRQDLPQNGRGSSSPARKARLRIERLDGWLQPGQTEILTAAPDVAVTLHRQQAPSRPALTLAVVALALIVAVAGGGYWLWRGTQQQVAAIPGQTAAEARPPPPRRRATSPR